jgi:hypothetical protein
MLIQTTISIAEIEAAKTSRGGWTRQTLAAWGVPWPPPRGWKVHLLENGIPYKPTDLAIKLPERR